MSKQVFAFLCLLLIFPIVSADSLSSCISTYESGIAGLQVTSVQFHEVQKQFRKCLAGLEYVGQTAYPAELSSDDLEKNGVNLKVKVQYLESVSRLEFAVKNANGERISTEYDDSLKYDASTGTLTYLLSANNFGEFRSSPANSVLEYTIVVTPVLKPALRYESKYYSLDFVTPKGKALPIKIKTSNPPKMTPTQTPAVNDARLKQKCDEEHRKCFDGVMKRFRDALEKTEARLSSIKSAEEALKNDDELQQATLTMDAGILNCKERLSKCYLENKLKKDDRIENEIKLGTEQVKVEAILIKIRHFIVSQLPWPRIELDSIGDVLTPEDKKEFEDVSNAYAKAFATNKDPKAMHALISRADALYNKILKHKITEIAALQASLKRKNQRARAFMNEYQNTANEDEKMYSQALNAETSKDKEKLKAGIMNADFLTNKYQDLVEKLNQAKQLDYWKKALRQYLNRVYVLMDVCKTSVEEKKVIENARKTLGGKDEQKIIDALKAVGTIKDALEAKKANGECDSVASPKPTIKPKPKPNGGSTNPKGDTFEDMGGLQGGQQIRLGLNLQPSKTLKTPSGEKVRTKLDPETGTLVLVNSDDEIVGKLYDKNGEPLKPTQLAMGLSEVGVGLFVIGMAVVAQYRWSKANQQQAIAPQEDAMHLKQRQELQTQLEAVEAQKRAYLQKRDLIANGFGSGIESASSYDTFAKGEEEKISQILRQASDQGITLTTEEDKRKAAARIQQLDDQDRLYAAKALAEANRREAERLEKIRQEQEAQRQKEQREGDWIRDGDKVTGWGTGLIELWKKATGKSD